LDGVHYLRTVDDAVQLHDAFRTASRVAVIGAGWIGSEVAASARQMGAEVVLIDPGPVPLRRVLGERIGGVFAGLHAENGVELRSHRHVRVEQRATHLTQRLAACIPPTRPRRVSARLPSVFSGQYGLGRE